MKSSMVAEVDGFQPETEADYVDRQSKTIRSILMLVLLKTVDGDDDDDGGTPTIDRNRR